MDLAAAALASYTLWLIAFPMEGFLVAPAGDPYALLFFLVPHAAALLASGLLLPPARLPSLTAASAVVAAAATAGFAWAPVAERPFLVAAGLGAAPLVLRVGVLLRGAASPNRSAVWGLAAGNIGVLGLVLVPAPVPAKALVLAGAVGLPALLPGPPRGASPEAPPAPALAPGFLHYLPFLLAFHMVSGLFYGRLVPAYEAARVVPGLELVFYVAAVLAAFYGVRASVDGSLAAGIPLGLLSLLLFRSDSRVALNLSMFTMQASAGFMDSFVLFLLLIRPDPLRAFGVGLGTLCLGIAGGKTLALLAGGTAATLTALGNAALNLALLSLYFAHRRAIQRHLVGPPPPPAAAAAATVTVAWAPPPFRVPPALRARLSPMEASVLERVLAGKTFREVAAELQVSESSVKTYMKRLYEKAGVRGKADLLAKLAREPGDGKKVER